MSQIDDILFSPIQSWRQLCRDVHDYIVDIGQKLKPMRSIYAIDRQRPPGSLTLERLMELYHVLGHRQFYCGVVYSSQKLIQELVFDGTIVFDKYEHGKCPLLGGFDQQRSIRDLNLVPNTYTRHFVFASEDEAQNYLDFFA